MEIHEALAKREAQLLAELKLIKQIKATQAVSHLPFCFPTTTADSPRHQSSQKPTMLTNLLIDRPFAQF